MPDKRMRMPTQYLDATRTSAGGPRFFLRQCRFSFIQPTGAEPWQGGYANVIVAKVSRYNVAATEIAAWPQRLPGSR